MAAEEGVPERVWVRIVSRHNTCLDDWGGATGYGSGALSKDDSPHSANRKWQLIPRGSGWYNIKSSKNTCVDDWGGKTGSGSVSYQKFDQDSTNRRFKFVSVGDGWFNIVSYHNTCLDDWGGETGHGKPAFQPFENSKNRQWKFSPVDYTLHGLMTNFDYEGDVERLLESNKEVAFKSTSRVTVQKDAIGGTVSEEYGESVSETFSWGLTQEIGIEISLEVKIPLMASEKQTMSAKFGANQQWTTTKTKDYKSSISFTPQSTGLFEVGKIVYISRDVILKYRATLEVTATNDVTGAIYNGKTAAILCRDSGIKGDVISQGDDSVIFRVEGQMKASYAVESENIFQKVGEI